MKFEFIHEFDADAQSVADALLDEDFQLSLSDIGPLKEREVLSQKRSKGSVHRRIRCVLDVKLNDLARSFLGSGDPAWVEDATWDPGTLTWDWQIEPEVAADKLSAGGTIEVAESSGGATRTVAGEVAVKGVPFYGGKVEGWIVDGLRATYEEEARRLEDWLEREK